MDLNNLEKAVLATIAYYDALDFPLTGFEVFEYLINPVRLISAENQFSEIEPINKIALKDVLGILNSRNLSFYLGEKNGFYFLKNKEHLIETRIMRQKISGQRWKKVRKIIKYLQIVPFIKMVAISGSLAMDNVKQESDIDLFIIAKNKRVWTTRFFTTLFFQIIGQRRYGKKIENRFCLNHYITDKSLKINFRSLANAQTYSHLVLVLEIEQGIYNKFQKQNDWIKDYLYAYHPQKLNSQRKIKTGSFLRFFAKIREFILNSFLGLILEKILGFFQKKLIQRHYLNLKGRGRIIVDETQLEFHPDAQEAKILDKYNTNMLRLGFKTQELDSGLTSKK